MQYIFELHHKLSFMKNFTTERKNYDEILLTGTCTDKQEAQLMLTNPRDALRGQSRSPNMVPFDMLGMVSH